jgi:DNA-binding GntR family transcriptional regulator
MPIAEQQSPRNQLASIRPPGGPETWSLAEQIASQLAEMIIKGDYEPGSRVHETAVSSRFKVSRGPVREALRLLEKEGLITILPRRGAVVTNLSIEEVRDIFEIRAVLFGLAMKRAAERQDPALIEGLKTRVARTEQIARAGGDDPDPYLAAAQELNLFVIGQSGSGHLTSMVYSLFRQTLRYSRLGLSAPQRRLQSAANWKQLLKAVIEGDQTTAEEFGKRLVDQSKVEAIKLLRKAEKAKLPRDDGSEAD